MRRTVALLSALLLLACQGPALGPAPGPVGLAADDITVTPLDSPQAMPPQAPAATQRPQTRPDAATADAPPSDTPATATPDPAAPEATEPEAPKSAEQLLCEKALGRWLSAGDTGANYCASMTRDGGKQCTGKSNCQGQCLARSGTCSPITPLYGCNDVLDKDGRQVTLCID